MCVYISWHVLYVQVMRNDEWDNTGGVGCGMSGNNC